MQLAFFRKVLLIPIARARSLRTDDRGQVMLLSGMMVFLVAIMAFVTLDTSASIYNRVIAQNAADAAADAAALWQARGCNLLQHLNNVHYEANVALYTAEILALTACAAAPYLSLIPFAGPALAEAACVACNFAPPIDKAQEVFAKTINYFQKMIVEIFPALAMAYGSLAAQGSGADPVGEVLTDYAGGLFEMAQINVPVVGDIAGVVGDVLGDLPVHAMPILPDSLSLYVTNKVAGDLELPWDFPSWLADVFLIAGLNFCGVTTESADWGWKDEYYWGNPGFMTWVAGKSRKDELLGLGDLAWFNAEARTYDEMVDTYSQTLYQGPIRTGDSNKALKIPALLGVASSQVDGEPVISHSKGDVDAEPHLITVHYQTTTDSEPKDTTSFLIFH